MEKKTDSGRTRAENSDKLSDTCRARAWESRGWAKAYSLSPCRALVLMWRSNLFFSPQDWPFDDGAPPPSKVVEDWLSLLKRRFVEEPGCCVAVHCVAGLGRSVYELTETQSYWPQDVNTSLTIWFLLSPGNSGVNGFISCLVAHK